MATITEQAPRLAWLILAHDHPQQLGRLLKRLAGGRCYVHVDARASAQTFAAMQAAVPAGMDVQFIARRPCYWGGFSLVSATLDLMRAALADGCAWATLLSGADYPLQTHTDIARFLAAQTTDGFIDIRTEAQFDVRYRWQTWHPQSWHGKPIGKLWQKLQRASQRLGWRRYPPVAVPQIFAGSQWWTLSAPACRALLAFCEQHPEVLRFFARTAVPDEMFFQSVLMQTSFAPRVLRNNLRLIRWQDGAWSPYTWQDGDIPELLASPALLARKFAPDGRVTTALDQALDGIRNATPDRQPS